jgi:hypothetical protein
MVVLGLLLGIVGTDIYTGTPRFTLGIRELCRRAELSLRWRSVSSASPRSCATSKTSTSAP